MILKDLIRMIADVTEEQKHSTIVIIMEWIKEHPSEDDYNENMPGDLYWVDHIIELIFTEIPVTSIICKRWNDNAWDNLIDELEDIGDIRTPVSLIINKAINNVLNFVSNYQKDNPSEFDINEVIEEEPEKWEGGNEAIIEAIRNMDNRSELQQQVLDAIDKAKQEKEY